MSEPDPNLKLSETVTLKNGDSIQCTSEYKVIYEKLQDPKFYEFKTFDDMPDALMDEELALIIQLADLEDRGHVVF